MIVQQLLERKFKLQEANIMKFQEIEKIKSERKKNLIQIDRLENNIREEFNFIKIKKMSEIR